MSPLGNVVRMAVVLLAGAACLASCGEGPKVIQGTVVSCDASAKALVVRDERPPQASIAFSLEGAEIGAEPQVGDVVRIAYREAAGRLAASRVMNLTRQKELGGLPGAGAHPRDGPEGK